MSPSMATTLPAASETNAASRPYSTAVAPLSSLMNLRMSVIARYSSYLASHREENTGAFNERCSNIVDGSRRTVRALGNRRHRRHFPQSSHELEPLHLCRCKTSLATALKYSVTINACLIGKTLLERLRAAATAWAIFSGSAESQGIRGLYPGT